MGIWWSVKVLLIGFVVAFSGTCPAFWLSPSSAVRMIGKVIACVGAVLVFIGAVWSIVKL